MGRANGGLSIVVSSFDVAAVQTRASSRQIRLRSERIGLLMRNGVTLIVVLVVAADPAVPRSAALLGTLAIWSLYRLLTRSLATGFIVTDYLAVLAVCLSIPALVTNPEFYLSNSGPQAIAGTAVVSFAVALPVAASLPMTAGIASAYAYGAAVLIGWEHLVSVGAIYYFAVQWLTGSIVRLALLRVARTVDDARAGRSAAEVGREVNAAVRDFGREQVALLHDTAASTLLMVAQDTPVPAARLAAQARQDLELLQRSTLMAPQPHIDVVESLRECAPVTATPLRFEGAHQLWLDGRSAAPVIAAAREAINNADRHANASQVVVNVNQTAVVISDDGIGFDPQRPRTGHGVDQSILARMRRSGGQVKIVSRAGSGTTIELAWPTLSPLAEVEELRDGEDPDRLIESIRTRYGLALVVYAEANLVFAVGQALDMSSDRPLQLALTAVAAAATLSAVPEIYLHRWRPVGWACFLLLGVAGLQPQLLDPGLVGGYAHWAQSVIGWCVLPHLMGLRTKVGMLALTGYWLAGALAQLCSTHSVAALVNIGLGTASILAVQLFALAFNGLIRDAADDAEAEVRSTKQLALRDRLERALHDEYRERYADLFSSILPLLRELSEGGRVDGRVRSAARKESRRLRALIGQSKIFVHPMMGAIRPEIDEAEKRGVDVKFSFSGSLPDVPPNVIDEILEIIGLALKRAGTAARITIHAGSEEVLVSIVCSDAPNDPFPAEASASVKVEVIDSASTQWILIRFQIAEKGELCDVR